MASTLLAQRGITRRHMAVIRKSSQSDFPGMNTERFQMTEEGFGEPTLWPYRSNEYQRPVIFPQYNVCLSSQPIPRGKSVD